MLKVGAGTVLKASRPRLVSLPIKTFSRSLITLKDHKYTAHATAKGKGRNGEVKSNGLELHLATPKELGGTGKGENPEQLFAMGYASCLLGAIQFVAARMGKDASKAVVHANVTAFTTRKALWKILRLPTRGSHPLATAFDALLQPKVLGLCSLYGSSPQSHKASRPL
ncbi:hypothetical protein C0992_011191 [Termitomyces sp. T32_za158]|nr:hypothetical protein C0992_011191 [Termitomyces sp. T32_za158]